MSKPEEPPAQKPKRQRKAFTCTFCKARKIKCNKARPRCSNCERLGRTCNYEVPYWVNTYVQTFNVNDTDGSNGTKGTNNGAPGTGGEEQSFQIQQEVQPEPQELHNKNKTQPQVQILDSNNKIPQDPSNQESKSNIEQLKQQSQSHIQFKEQEIKSRTPSLPSQVSQQSRTSEDLIKEIEFWKAKATALSSQTTRPTSYGNSVSSTGSMSIPLNEMLNHNNEFEGHSEDRMDFHEAYSKFSIYYGGHKPLSPMFIHKADGYLSLLHCLRYITLELSNESIAKQDPTTITSGQNPMSDWVSMLDSKSRGNRLKDNIRALLNDRSELFTTDSSTSSNFRDIEYLKTNIEFILPRKDVFDKLLEFYFDTMWILRPIVDKETFINEISRIVVFENNLPEINISQTSDFAHLAIMLIIIRYASTSILITSDKNLRADLAPLKDEIISVKAITIAQKCLSICDVIRNSNFTTLQALVLLRYYCKDSPEDGDDLNLEKSQTFFGFIVQHALNLGLNRDPTTYTVGSDLKTDNLKRFIWHSIVSLDLEACVMGGFISIIPSSSLINVKLPQSNSHNTPNSSSNAPSTNSNNSSEHSDPVIQASIDEHNKNAPLYSIYYGIVDAVNDLNEKPTLSSLVNRLREARSYVEKHYPLDHCTSLIGHFDHPSLRMAALFKNHKILQQNLMFNSLELTLYQLLYIQFEINSNISRPTFKSLYKSCLHSLTKSVDLCSAYLSGVFDQYIDHSFSDFALFPLITSLTYRCSNSVLSSMLRTLHGRELLLCHLYTPGSNIDTDHFLSFLQPICNMWEAYLRVFEDGIGPKYFTSLKIICAGKFKFMYIKADRFTLMNEIINFCEADAEYEHDEEIHKRKEEVRSILRKTSSIFSVHTQWLQLSKSYEAAMKLLKPDVKRRHKYCYAICNLNYTNQTAELFEKDIQELISMVKTGIRYCPSLLHNNNVNTYLGDDHPDKKGIPPSEITGTTFGTLREDPAFNAQMAYLLQGMQGVPSETDNCLVVDIFGPTIEVQAEFRKLMV